MKAGFRLSGGVSVTKSGTITTYGRVLHQHSRIPVIRMIVIGARRNDDVRLPLADFADDLLTDLPGRQELAVVVIEHFVFDADASPGFLRLSAATLGKFFSAHRLHLVAEHGILGGDATCAEVAIVGMRTEGDDAHRLVLCTPQEG